MFFNKVLAEVTVGYLSKLDSTPSQRRKEGKLDETPSSILTKLTESNLKDNAIVASG